MKSQDIIEALNDIDQVMVEDAVIVSQKSVKRGGLKLGVVAAAIVLIIAPIAIFGALKQKDDAIQPDALDIGINSGSIEGNTSFMLSGTTADASSGTTVETPSDTTVAFTYVDPDRDNGQRYFNSLAEYQAYESGRGDEAVESYYIPSAVDEKYELWYVFKQEVSDTISFSFVDVKYKLKGVTISDESLTEEGLNSISCRYYTATQTTEGFENYVKGGGFKRVEGREGVYSLSHYSSAEGRLMSYQVIFLKDGHLISIQLPAIDTLENLLVHIDVIRIDNK